MQLFTVTGGGLANLVGNYFSKEVCMGTCLHSKTGVEIYFTFTSIEAHEVLRKSHFRVSTIIFSILFGASQTKWCLDYHCFDHSYVSCAWQMLLFWDWWHWFMSRFYCSEVTWRSRLTLNMLNWFQIVQLLFRLNISVEACIDFKWYEFQIFRSRSLEKSAAVGYCSW